MSFVPEFDIEVTTVDLLDLTDQGGSSPPGIASKIKEHIRCDPDEDIDAYINAAISLVESESGRSLHERELLLRCSWSGRCPVDLFRGPVESVSSVEYYFTDGSLNVLDSELYRVLHSKGERLVLIDDALWPSLDTNKNTPVEIVYSVGSPDLDSKAFQAVAFMAAHFYKNREAVEVSNKTPIELPFAARALIDSMMEGL